jgi:hypothetical protein
MFERAASGYFYSDCGIELAKLSSHLAEAHIDFSLVF